MSSLQAPSTSSVPGRIFPARYPWWRILVLCLLLLLSIVVYILLIDAAPKSDSLIVPFLHVWMLSFLPYFAACIFVLATKASEGRWSRIELGIILVGALILRAMLLPLPPGLSHDSWRYLWDARVILHGYSPYVYAPWDKVLQPLQDVLIYGNSRFRNVPTLYPPGAEALYVLSYLLAPSNLFVLKGIFVVFDMVTCGTVALLLAYNGLDPRRVIIYAWSPLPIVEFAIQGHVDVITLTFTVLAVLSASNSNGSRDILDSLPSLVKRRSRLIASSTDDEFERARSARSQQDRHQAPSHPLIHPLSLQRRGRYLPDLDWKFSLSAPSSSVSIARQVLTGILVGLGMLTKIYPILLLVVVFHHQRKWTFTQTMWRNLPLLVACFATILLGYIPFLILGHGQAFGVFISYTNEQGQNAGVMQQVTAWLGHQLHLKLAVIIVLEHTVDLVLLGSASLIVLLLRLRERISMEAATILLIGTVLSISSHVFPWYTTALLPWIALLSGPLWTRKGFNPRSIAVAAVWYFTCTSIFSYFYNGALSDWTAYYRSVYDVTMAGLVIAALAGIVKFYLSRKGQKLTVK